MKNTVNNLTNDSLNMRTDTPSEDEITQLKALKKDLDLFLKTRFKKNLKALEKFDPMLARRYKHYTPSQKQEFFCSLNGIPNLYYPDSLLVNLQKHNLLYKFQIEFLYHNLRA